MHSHFFHTSKIVLLSCVCLFAGCADEAARQDKNAAGQGASIDDHGHGHNHDHDHAPTTVREALAALTALRNTTRDAFAANDMDAAHDPLHEVGNVLTAIPELAKKENVDPEQQPAIQKAVDTLLDAFGRVDKTMHGQEGSTYAEESATIDAALLELESLLNPPAPAQPDAETAQEQATATPATSEGADAPASK